jgi:hypothetical protein
MLTGLLASARELRNPLTVGYSAMLVFWLVAGEEAIDAARNDALGRRIVTGLDSIGAGANLALCTFAAAIIGSLMWNGGVSRFVRFLSFRARHPDWDGMIEEAKQAVQRYEGYNVVTYKGQSGGRPSAFDASHSVPSPHHAIYLHARVDERERKAAEMSFRVTLAVALVPVALALGVEGGGRWWWSLCAIPVVWLDVAFMKHTTLRVVRRFRLEDLQSDLEQAEKRLEWATTADAERDRSEDPDPQAEIRKRELGELKDRVKSLRAEIKRLHDDDARLGSKLFALLEGRTPG